MSPLVGTILVVVFIALVVLVISRSIRIVPQATAASWSGSAGITAP